MKVLKELQQGLYKSVNTCIAEVVNINKIKVFWTHSLNKFCSHFRTVVSYKTSTMPLYTDETINLAPNLGEYDSLDENVIQEYNEFILASKVYYALKEAACSEQSARMTAMDAASKNAGKNLMIKISYITWIDIQIGTNFGL